MKDTRKRSVVKALSWRFVATLITSAIVWLLTGQAKFAATVGVMDTAVKLFVYYFHERAWDRIDYGRKHPDIEYQI